MPADTESDYDGDEPSSGGTKRRVRTAAAAAKASQEPNAKSAHRAVARQLSAVTGAGLTEPMAGIIVNVEMENFMCHRKFSIDFVRLCLNVRVHRLCI